MSYWSFRQALVNEAVCSAERNCAMEEPEVFDFLVEDTPPGPRTEPPRRPTHQGRRICSYWGERIIAWLMEHTRPLDDEQCWHEAVK
jgi:hypothetical protein